MDLLAKRWANPYLILDEFIKLNQLHDFITEIVQTIADERIYDARWNFYLHKVCLTSEMSFEDSVSMCEQSSQESSSMSYEKIGSVISDSKNMLFNFTWE